MRFLNRSNNSHNYYDENHDEIKEIVKRAHNDTQFLETKYNGHIHKYGTHIFSEIIVYIS